MYVTGVRSFHQLPTLTHSTTVQTEMHPNRRFFAFLQSCAAAYMTICSPVPVSTYAPRATLTQNCIVYTSARNQVSMQKSRGDMSNISTPSASLPFLAARYTPITRQSSHP